MISCHDAPATAPVPPETGLPPIHLLTLGERSDVWRHGGTSSVSADVSQVADALASIVRQEEAEWVLVWDGEFPLPSEKTLKRLTARTDRGWHGGLALGMRGLPGLLDFVAPVSFLGLDAPAEIESTSWRLNLRACLLPTAALRLAGGVNEVFDTLCGAGLELGYRLLSLGLLLRHSPKLVAQASVVQADRLSLADEARFVRLAHDSFWTRWALARAVMTGYASSTDARASWRASTTVRKSSSAGATILSEAPPSHSGHSTAPVSVIIPTVDRYRYLRTVLSQLREQTVQPLEVLIVDQTSEERRQRGWAAEFPDLPIQYIEQNTPGQCTARNTAISASTGEFLLFLDDDDEIEPDLIERHLAAIHTRDASAICGSADEVGSPKPAWYRHVARASDVLSTNNTLLRRSALAGSGLFDLAYDNGRNEDGDLCARLLQSGALLVFEPSISVLHHHAPQGGLRIRKARVITYSSSRRKLMHRSIPSVSELYLWRRYFNPRQVREAKWQSAAGTLAGAGSRWFKVAKAVTGAIFLPNTILRMRRNDRLAQEMLARYPDIPEMPAQCCFFGSNEAPDSGS